MEHDIRNFIRAGNGFLIWKGKGKPPNQVDGYEPDPMEPGTFKPVWVKCIYRETKRVRLRCGKMKTTDYCQLMNIPFITREYCKNCNRRVENDDSEINTDSKISLPVVQ